MYTSQIINCRILDLKGDDNDDKVGACSVVHQPMNHSDELSMDMFL